MKIKPGVPKVWLYLTAGFTWTVVGAYLVSLTGPWIAPAPKSIGAVIIAAGVSLGLAIYSFGFSRLAKKNVNRITAINSQKPCFFAFQQWWSIPLVAFMISLGIFLRIYSPISKQLLAVMYIGIGSSLFTSSLHYYHHVWRLYAGNRQEGLSQRL